MIEKIIAALLGALPLFKKKPYCLWLWAEAQRWENRNAAGSSARRCKKARKVLIGIGYEASHIIIMPKGFDPPAILGG